MRPPSLKVELVTVKVAIFLATARPIFRPGGINSSLGIKRATVLRLGRDICGDFPSATRREWLVTNGLGGYAAGTIAGALTRRYHGLLVAATRPPLGRTATLAKLEGVATYLGTTYRFGSNRWHDGSTAPDGERFIERFELEGTVPLWSWAFADALLEQRIWMEHGANTTFVQFRLVRASAPLRLTLAALAEYRDFHTLTHAYDAHPAEAIANGVRFAPYEGALTMFLRTRAAIRPRNEWYYGFRYDLEAERGLDCVGDLLHIADLEAELRRGETLAIVASLEEDAPIDDSAALQRRREADAAAAARAPDGAPRWIRRLFAASEAFIVDRPTPDRRGSTKTVIAGYPWFGDWGRDTMISLAGLTLVTGVFRSRARSYGPSPVCSMAGCSRIASPRRAHHPHTTQPMRRFGTSRRSAPTTR